MEKALEELVDELRLLWNALVQWADRLHARDSVTTARRAVLEFLARNGPATVPNIARSRRVTRQHVQALVNGLLEAGLVEAIENAAHRRSVLIRLTSEGERTFRGMQRREAGLARRLRGRVGEARLRAAAATLRAVRAAVEDAGAAGGRRKGQAP